MDFADFLLLTRENSNLFIYDQCNCGGQNILNVFSSGGHTVVSSLCIIQLGKRRRRRIVIFVIRFDFAFLCLPFFLFPIIMQIFRKNIPDRKLPKIPSVRASQVGCFEQSCPFSMQKTDARNPNLTGIPFPGSESQQISRSRSVRLLAGWLAGWLSGHAFL